MTVDDLIDAVAIAIGQVPAPAYAPVSPARVFEAYAFGRIARGLLVREPNEWSVDPAPNFCFRQNNGEVWGSDRFTHLVNSQDSRELHQSITVLGQSTASHELDVVMITNCDEYRRRRTRPKMDHVEFGVDTKWYENDGVVGQIAARALLGAALDLGLAPYTGAFRYFGRARPGMCLAAHGPIHPEAAVLLATWGQGSVEYLDTCGAAWLFS